MLSFAALAVAAIGLYSATPPFWSLPTAFLRRDGAAAGIGLINSVGNLGGFVGPYLMGWMQRRPGDFRGGLLGLAASAFCSGLLVLTIRTGVQGSGFRVQGSGCRVRGEPGTTNPEPRTNPAP